MYLNIIKALHDKPTANIILKGGRLKAFSAKVRNIRVPTPIQHSTRSHRQSSRVRKKNKDIRIRKELVKLSPFVDDMILYIQNPKDTPPKKSGYKINIQKAVVL